MVPIAGVQWTTLLDYPDRVATTLFTLGCDFRCPFCHNAELVDPARYAAPLDNDEILERLRERRGFSDAVVVTGGEPTLHPELPAFLERIQKLGFLIKLDTNGGHPEMLATLMELGRIDYVAMDVKAPPEAYDRLTGGTANSRAIEASIQTIIKRAPDYEFRTTVAPTLTAADMRLIARWLREDGAKRFVLQTFRAADGTGKALLDPSWAGRSALPVAALEALWQEIGPGFDDGGVRG